jgi:signal transduction histidine kinase/FixJ family two-component response regulator
MRDYEVSQLTYKVSRLKSLNKRLNRILRIAKVGGWEIDIKTNKLSWSQIVKDIHEVHDDYQPELKTALDFYPHPERDNLKLAVNKAIHYGIPWELELPLITAKGKHLFIRASGEPEIADGKIIKIIGTLQDITQEIQQRTELESIRERLTLATISSNAGVWEYNLIDDILIWDDKMFEIFDVPKDHFEGKYISWRNTVLPEDLEPTEELLKKCILEGTEFHTVFRIKSPFGKIKYIKGDAIVIQDDKGNAVRVVGLNSDVTDQQTNKKKLEKAIELAQTANAHKSQFLAHMNHEIRTPLTSILGFTEKLLDTPSLHEDVLHDIKTIRLNSSLLLNIVNKILDFSKISSGKLDLEYTHCSFFTTVRDIERIFKEKAAKKGLLIRVGFVFPLPEKIYTDELRLRQILTNLVENAIKFTFSGEITIKVRYDSSQEILLYSVVDTGIGLSEESMKKIFEPFLQADTSSTKNFGGTGLGLPIAKALVKELGGRLIVKSHLNEGSDFTFSLPFRNKESTEFVTSETKIFQDNPSERTFRSPYQLHGRILIAEDGLDNQKLLKHHLESFGLHCTFVDNGEAAINKAFDEDFQLVIMDMQMPIMDGYTATSILRSQGYEQPILALTANNFQDLITKCLNVGCSDFVGKPFTKQDLYEKMSLYLDEDIAEEALLEQKNSRALKGIPAPHLLSRVSDYKIQQIIEDDPEMVTAIKLFIKLSKERIKNIRMHLNTSNFEGLVKEIHNLKGAASFGYKSIGDISSKIEVIIQKGNTDTEELEGLVTSLENSLEQIVQQGVNTSTTD